MLVGRMDEAAAQLDAARKRAPDLSDVYALQALLAVARNDRPRAVQLAAQALRLQPASSAAWIALSYAQQAQFDVRAAHESALRAVSASPASALAVARLAELQLALGALGDALATAREAARLDPESAKAQGVLGFTLLARVQTAPARTAFERSIVLDPSDPMTRLGLGLAKIREGDLAGGRSEIEIAAALDPLDSLVRSYLGKAYFEEYRDELAAVQYSLARARDPLDPTPYFYDALRLMAANRPVEALSELNQSIALNDNRIVYRSRLLIDDDRAARTTSLAGVYGELGFERLALAEGAKALGDNLGNYSAHRYLAQAFVDQPRHDIARVSESLQAQIRQPLTLSPIDTELGSDHLGILRGGPSLLAANEFNQLFTRDEIRWRGDVLLGSRGTAGDQVAVSGIAGRFAFAASQLHYKSDGFGDNDRAQKDIVTAFVQAQPLPTTSLQLEAKRSEVRLGNTFSPFDPTFATPATIGERSYGVRLNGRFEESPQADWVASVAGEYRTRTVDTFPDGMPLAETDAHTRSIELQHLRRFDGLQVLLGLADVRLADRLPGEGVDVPEKSFAAYAYALWHADPHLTLHGGLSYDRLKIDNPFFTFQVERNQFNPKLGLVWTPATGTTVRAAWLTTVRRPLVASQTLEPTQVAGFTQFFSGFDTFYGDPTGTISRRTALGVDQQFGSRIFSGAEIARRQVRVPSLSAARDFKWYETNARAYVYATLLGDPQGAGASRWSLAAAFEYELEKLSRPLGETGAEGIVHVATHRAPFGIRVYRDAFAVHASAVYLRQTGLFSIGEGFDTFPKKSSGWLMDFAAHYTLPQRTGTLVVGVRNAFDRRIEQFHSDPFAPRDALRRLVYAKVGVAF